MAKAFQCDRCDALQEGDPDQSISIAPKHGGSSTKQLCSACLASFNDWYSSGVPLIDRPERVR